MDAAPVRGDFAHRARDELRVNVTAGQLRENRSELAKPDQRFAADDRYVQRPLSIDQGEHAVNQLLAFEVADFAECDVAAEMIVAVGVTARTPQRTFTRDFN